MTTTTSPRKYDPNTAFVIELVAGFFGLLGVGYMYVGRTEEGILRLVLWLLYTVVAAISLVLLSALIIGLCLIPFALVIQVIVPLLSAISLKNKLLQDSSVQAVTVPPQQNQP